MRTPENTIHYYLFERGKSLEYVRQIALSREDRKLEKAVNDLQGMDLEEIRILVEPVEVEQSLEVVEVECELVEGEVA
jgi:hypothetical protein